MLSYTKGTLKAALLAWNRNAAPEFEDNLDDIIQRGELELMRAIDFDPLIDENDTTTTADAAEVFKPDNLLNETELWITVSGVRTPLLKRSRAWVKLMGNTSGTPKYYCDLDEDRWSVGPPAADAYLIEVTGQYAPESITDGDDNTTTYFSTVIPDLLYLACSINACAFLKAWSQKDIQAAEFAAKVAVYRGLTAQQELVQAADQVAGRVESNPMKGPGA